MSLEIEQEYKNNERRELLIIVCWSVLDSLGLFAGWYFGVSDFAIGAGFMISIVILIICLIMNWK